MPHVNFNTPTGPVELHYNIATPTSPSSPTIAEDLPCVIFIHSGYIAQEVFEPQFQDPELRERFNLIGLDMRSWGTTKGRVERNVYTPEVAADDIYMFMKELDLPPVHVFALSIGCAVALELAVAHPDLLRSITLCSPLPPDEPEDIAAGRHQVYHYWSHSFNHDGTTPPGMHLESDKEMLEDLSHGSQQLMFNDQISRLTEAMTASAVEHAIHNWAGTPEKLAVAYTVCVDWFINRRPLVSVCFSGIKCPVTIIHCADDIAYPLRHAQELRDQLIEAGIGDVTLCQVSGPHFGSAVNPQAVNPILCNAVISASSTPNLTSKNIDLSTYQCHDRPKMVTPFAEQLARNGYDPFADDTDSDCDSDIFITR